MGMTPGSRVVIARGRDGTSLLSQALRLSRFWEHLERIRRKARVSTEDCRIVIKPDLALYDRGSPTATDPALVEGLIRLLNRRGYMRVAVGAASDESGMWLDNRDPPILADLSGYRFETTDGQPYEVLDLSEDQVFGGFGPESVLAGSCLGRAWSEAHFRICFGKVKTDDENFFVLGAESLCDILPLR